MRLSEESIKYILDLQKNMLPLIYCCANNERLGILEDTIKHYNGIFSYKDSKLSKEEYPINTLLIFLDEMNFLFNFIVSFFLLFPLLPVLPSSKNH